MAALFERVGNYLNNSDRQELRNSQHRWLKERLDCGDDFLCTKEAYIERIDRLNSVLAKVRDRSNRNQPVAQCSVTDPNPPLNVRTTPNCSIVGALSNGTRVVVFDYNANRSWAFVGRYEDRSPIGWVYVEYIDCKTNDPPDWFSVLRGIRL
jgi:uncharacterized protein